jgi:hypothetical protein
MCECFASQICCIHEEEEEDSEEKNIVFIFWFVGLKQKGAPAYGW